MGRPVQLIRRLTQAGISCTTKVRLFFLPLVLPEAAVLALGEAAVA